MRTVCLIAFFCLFAAAYVPGAHADNDAENIVVTATRTMQPAEKTGESISVIEGFGSLKSVRLNIFNGIHTAEATCFSFTFTWWASNSRNRKRMRIAIGR